MIAVIIIYITEAILIERLIRVALAVAATRTVLTFVPVELQLARCGTRQSVAVARRRRTVASAFPPRAIGSRRRRRENSRFGCGRSSRRRGSGSGGWSCSRGRRRLSSCGGRGGSGGRRFRRSRSRWTGKWSERSRNAVSRKGVATRLLSARDAARKRRWWLRWKIRRHLISAVELETGMGTTLTAWTASLAVSTAGQACAILIISTTHLSRVVSDGILIPVIIGIEYVLLCLLVVVLSLQAVVSVSDHVVVELGPTTHSHHAQYNQLSHL